MQPRSPKLLEDIRDAAAFILDATRGKDLDVYRNDRLLRRRSNGTSRLSAKP